MGDQREDAKRKVLTRFLFLTDSDDCKLSDIASGTGVPLGVARTVLAEFGMGIASGEDVSWTQQHKEAVEAYLYSETGELISSDPPDVSSPTERGESDSHDSATRFTDYLHLGAGAHGDVWKATDNKLGRTVALKFVPMPVRDATALAHARALAKLSHSRIVQVHDVLEDVSQPDTGAICDAVVMEFVEGQELEERLGEPDLLSAKEAQVAATGVLEALGYLQTHGVVHGDLHAGNVMLTADGPKLIDVTHDRLVSQSTATLDARLAGDRDAVARLIAAILKHAGLAAEPFLRECPTRTVDEQRAAIALVFESRQVQRGDPAERRGSPFAEIEAVLASAQIPEIAVAGGYWEAAGPTMRPIRWQPQGPVQFRREGNALVIGVPRGRIFTVTVPFGLIEHAWLDNGRPHIMLTNARLVLRPETGLQIEPTGEEDYRADSQPSRSAAQQRASHATAPLPDVRVKASCGFASQGQGTVHVFGLAMENHSPVDVFFQGFGIELASGRTLVLLRNINGESLMPTKVAPGDSVQIHVPAQDLKRSLGAEEPRVAYATDKIGRRFDADSTETVKSIKAVIGWSEEPPRG